MITNVWVGHSAQCFPEKFKAFMPDIIMNLLRSLTLAMLKMKN